MKKERIKKEGSEENKEKRRKLVMNQSSPLVSASPLNRISFYRQPSLLFVTCNIILSLGISESREVKRNLS